MEQVDAEFDRKVRKGIFHRGVARFLAGDPDAENRLQDAICQAWLVYRRNVVEKGKKLDDALLVYFCRLRAMDPSRRFVCGDHQRRSQDIFHPCAWRRGIKLDPIDVVDAESSVGFAVEMASNPTRKILSAIDLENWFDGLTERDQRLLEGKATGQTLTEIANDVGRSVAWTHGRVRALGRELAQRADVEVDRAA